MFKKLVLIAVLSMAPAVAMAHFHTVSQRDATIRFCENAWDNDTMSTVASRLRSVGASAEDIDYTLDMCMAYLKGITKGAAI